MKYVRTKDGMIFDIDKIKNQIMQNMCQADREHISCFALTPTTDIRGALELSWVVDYRDSDSIKKDFATNELVTKHAVILNCESAEYKQADTIEELCDEFVSYDKEYGYMHFTELGKINGNYDYINEEYDKFYGAIWTDKGLQFVARMNNEGVMELL